MTKDSTDILVKIGLNSDGKPRKVPAKELAGRLYGRGWVYPNQLKQEYDISDELWPDVQRKIAGEYRNVFRNMRGNSEDVQYLDTNKTLSQYALALPHGATGQVMATVNSHLVGGKTQELEDYIFQLTMAPTYRARLVAKRYNKEPIFQEIAYLIESSYHAFLRDNFAAAFMTIIPVIEGVIQRWANTSKKLTFPQMWDFVRKAPVRNPLLSVPLFADVWAETCAAIMEKHLYKNTEHGPSFSDFNRHLALHVIERKDFGTPHNLARAFLLLDLLGDLYLAEHNKYDGIDMNPDEVVLPYLQPYLSIIADRTNNVEKTMVRYPQYKALLDAYERIGDPAVYWENPLMLSFRDIISKIAKIPNLKR